MSDLLRIFMGSGIRPWLRNDGSERLFTLHLKGVENPLDPDPYWESSYGGGGALYEVGSDHNARLKEALDAHRKLSPEKDEFDFPVEKMLVFSDVVMWLPEKIWKASVREGGDRLYMLSEKLKYRHRTDFGGELYKQREPHYAIMSHKSLPMDEVYFQFGLGVYLPRDGDLQTAEIKIVQQGQEPTALPNWTFFDGQSVIDRPASLYAEQHFLLLGRSLQESAIQSPCWFSENKGYLMIDTHRRPNQIYGDDEYIEAGKARVFDEVTVCPFNTVNTDNNEELKLIIERISELPTENTDRPDYNDTSGDTVISTPNDYSDDPLDGLTVIGGNDEPMFRYYIAITGIILPRINYSGIKYWILHLDQHGMPAGEDESSYYQLRGNQMTLEWCETESKQWQALETNNPLSLSEECVLNFRPAALSDKQHAILMLPQALAFSLSHQEVTLGRDKNNDIPLQLLNRTDSIQWLRATRRKQSMGHLGLSAKHLSMSIKGQSLLVRQQSSSVPTYVLEDKVISQTLDAGSYAEIKLKSNQEVIVGNYLLQYQKEFIYDNKV